MPFQIPVNPTRKSVSVVFPFRSVIAEILANFTPMSLERRRARPNETDDIAVIVVIRRKSKSKSPKSGRRDGRKN